MDEPEVTKMCAYNKHGDSAIVYYHVTQVPNKRWINKEIKKFNLEEDRSIFDDLYRGCVCSYDCCGHWNSGSIHLIGFDDVMNVAVVSLSFYQNV